MKIARILIDFRNLSNAKLEGFSSKVYSGMNDKPIFPAPNPSMADLNTAIQAFNAAVAAAKIGGPTDKEIRKVKKTDLVSLLVSLANDLMKTANGDRTMLVSSGYNISAESFSPAVLGLFENFTVKLGKVSGSVVLKSNGVKNAKSYTFQYTPAPVAANAVWVSQSFSKATYTFTGLEPGKEYSFRMIAIGSNGQISYSEIITKMVV